MSHADFHLAILESPADDVHRLVYADWLDEQGDADRAEFIRAQVHRAALPVFHPEARALAQREAELLAVHRHVWVGRVGELVSRYTFCRGFIEEVSLSVEAFVQHGEEILRLTPLRRVQIRAVPTLEALLLGDRTAVVRFARLLARVPELDFNREYVSDTLGRLLLDLPQMPRPRALFLPRLTPGGLLALASSDVLDNVVTLDLNPGVAAPEGLEPLLASPHLNRLRNLQIRSGRLGNHLVEVLTRSPQLLRLQSLSLGHNALTDEGVHELLTALWGGPLEALDLSFNPLGPSGLRALLSRTSKPTRLPALTTVNLSRTGLGNTGARLLAESSLLSQVQALDLSLNRIGDDGASALAEGEPPVRLLLLDLIYNHFGSQMREILAERFGPEVCVFAR
jgi:uncharacterized protein (TIGR02996 family)